MKWNVSWMSTDHPPHFNSVKFKSLYWAVVTCFRMWRAGCTSISLHRFKGGKP